MITPSSNPWVPSDPSVHLPNVLLQCCRTRVHVGVPEVRALLFAPRRTSVSAYSGTAGTAYCVVRPVPETPPGGLDRCSFDCGRSPHLSKV